VRQHEPIYPVSFLFVTRILGYRRFFSGLWGSAGFGGKGCGETESTGVQQRNIKPTTETRGKPREESDH
jgi:phage tail tape-measure protein